MSDTLDLASLRRDDSKETARQHVNRVASNLVPRSIPITIRKYVSPDGGEHSCVVTSTILSADDRLRVGRRTAQTIGGSWESTPPNTRTLCWMLAFLAHALGDEQPGWFKKWVVDDPYLTAAVYEEVMRHEARYFLGDDDAGAPETKVPRIFISSAASSRPSGEPGKSVDVESQSR